MANFLIFHTSTLPCISTIYFPHLSNFCFAFHCHNLTCVSSKFLDCLAVSQFNFSIFCINRKVSAFSRVANFLNYEKGKILYNTTYNICDIEGVRYLTKLRVRFSLLNEHKFRHNFDSLTPLCACGIENEDNEHFLLHCPQFHLMRQNLFGQLYHIPGLILNLDDKPLCELLLFGDTQLNVASNRKILEATISFIKDTKRFSNTN